MQYQYAQKLDYSDYMSGRVLYHFSGNANFPLRLGLEIFLRARAVLKKDRVVLYDPCCGNAYLLAALGFLANDALEQIYASDADPTALAHGQANLSLLMRAGLERREEEIRALLKAHGNESHVQALQSLPAVWRALEREIASSAFLHNIAEPPPRMTPPPDIIFADVPYGRLAEWIGLPDHPVETMLASLYPVAAERAVIAVCTAKGQAFGHEGYARLKRLKAGARVITLLGKGIEPSI